MLVIEKITREYNSATESVDQNTGLTHVNAETTMDWPEHQHIVLQAAALLSPALTGITNASALTALKHLRNAHMNDLAGYSTRIIVTKLIHQPYTNPHIQLKTKSVATASSGGPPDVLYTFHLNVSCEPVTTEGFLDRFHWVGKQFSCRFSSTNYAVPAVATIVAKVAPALPGAVEPTPPLVRRQSISTASLAAHVAYNSPEATRIREALAAAEVARVRAEAAAATGRVEAFDLALPGVQSRHDIVFSEEQVRKLRNGDLITFPGKGQAVKAKSFKFKAGRFEVKVGGTGFVRA